MQRVILFYCECSSHSAALCISDDKISANWMRLRPLTVANGTSGHSWFVIRLIVNMEIKIRGHSGYPSPKTVKKTGKFKVIKCSDSAEYDMDIVNMAAVLESIEWEDIDANDLELLSRALILALRIEIVCHEGDSATGNNVSHGRNRVTSERSSAALLERVSTQCQRVCDTSKQDSSRHPLFVARTYSSCLNWLQKHFQNNKEVQLPALEPQLIPVIVAGEVITIVLQSLSACTMWGHTGSSILAVLRALGNCLSHVPVQCFEGQLGAALCSALGSCVCSLQAGLYPENSALSGRDYKVSPEHSKDILNTCYTLASLVSGKCLGRKLFASAASLAASTLLAASRAATASAVEETTGSMCGSPPPTADFTAESATLNRILSNLVTACSLGYCDVADLDAHHRPLSERGNIVSSTDAAEEQVEDREGGYTTIIEACSAIFKSTYAEEFLYSVCADVQLRVCNTRPSHLPSVVDIGTAEAAIRFLGLLQKAAEVHNTAIEGENVLVLIHFRSHCLWSAVTVPGASDAAAASVIESLKAIGEGIDPLVMDSIAAVRGKSKAKKPVRGEKVPKSALLPRGTSPEESLRSLSCHLRAWMLLAMWGLPISAAQVRAAVSSTAQCFRYYGLSSLLSSSFSPNPICHSTPSVGRCLRL